MAGDALVFGNRAGLGARLATRMTGQAFRVEIYLERVIEIVMWVVASQAAMRESSGS